MNSETQKITQNDLVQTMNQMGACAKQAAAKLAIATTEQKNVALSAISDAIKSNRATILSANAIDMKIAEQNGITGSFLDRLMLNDERINGMCAGINSIAEFNDPVGSVIAEWERPNGLKIERVRTPLGVIGVIFESRPNVTADAGALCIKAGNAVILRAGTDSFHSSRAIHSCLVEGLAKAKLPKETIQIVPMTDRAAVGEMLKGLNGAVDVIIPRGGKSLVKRVQNEARVPVFAHLEGLCHVYVDKSSDVDMARKICLNAKMRRTGICGSAETLLIDEAALETHLDVILTDLKNAGCEIRGSKEISERFSDVILAEDVDWETEYLAPIISVKSVDGIDGAIAHINQWSSNHTEAVIAENPTVVERFFNEIDSSILLHNASTQFADGGEFGMGGEIGIATGKMHARGPVGVEQLTSFKYRVRGDGQTRP